MPRLHPSRLARAALLAGLLFSLGAATPEEERRLASGEVLVRLVESPGGGPKEGVGMAVVDAPPSPDVVILLNSGHHRISLPVLRALDTRRRRDGAAVSAQS